MDMFCSKTNGFTMETSSVTQLVSLFFFSINTKTFYTKKIQVFFNPT